MAGFRRKSSGPGIVKLREDLSAGRFQPCYLLAGEDVVRTRGVVDYVTDQVLGESGKAFNAHVYDGEEIGLDTVLQQALSFPMMCPHQVLWVKRADQLCAGMDDETALENYLKKPSPETILILSAEKMDGRKKWVKAGKSAGYLYEMEPPQGSELERWIQKAARERGFSVDRETVALLVEQSGEDLVSLGHELDKLAVITLDEGRLPDAETIRDLILAQRAVDPFEFLGRLGPGKAAVGMVELQRYLEEGRSAYELAPLIVWKVKQSAQVATMLDGGMNERDISGALGASPYAVKQAASVARSWGSERVHRALLAVARADRQLKGSAATPESILETVILEICT